MQWRNYILSKYREHQHEQDPAVAARLRSSANDYSVMFKSTMTRQVRALFQPLRGGLPPAS